MNVGNFFGFSLESLIPKPFREAYYDILFLSGESDGSNKEAVKRINEEAVKRIKQSIKEVYSGNEDAMTIINREASRIINPENNKKSDIDEFKLEAKKRIYENISKVILACLILVANIKLYPYTKSSDMSTFIPLGFFILSPSSTILSCSFFFISRTVNAVANMCFANCFANLGTALFSAIFSHFLLEKHTFFCKKKYLGVPESYLRVPPERFILDNICVPILMWTGNTIKNGCTSIKKWGQLPA